MIVRYTRQALADLDSALAWIAAERPAAAENVGKRVHEAIGSLREFPERGRPGRVRNTRELVVAGTPFVVPYRVGSQQVDVLAILHGARMWPSDFG